MKVETRWKRVAMSATATLLLVASDPLFGQDASTERTLRICERMGRSDIETGIEGVVRDKESEVPLPGATVTIRYDDERGEPTPEPVTVTADGNGRYQACGLTAFRRIRVRARYEAHRGKERRVDLDRPKFVDLEVDLGDPAFLVFSVVAAEDGRPVRGASLEFSPLPVSSVTDSLGRAVLRAIPPGHYGLRVEHVAFNPRDETIDILTGQDAELRVELVTRAVALAPLEVTITGRDPYLLTSGFYDRRAIVDDGYFATYPEIESYRDLETLFRFKRELSIRFFRNRLIFIDGYLASRLGYTERDLGEIRYRRVKGIEAYRCTDAPPSIVNQLPDNLGFVDCNLVVIWTR